MLEVKVEFWLNVENMLRVWWKSLLVSTLAVHKNWLLLLSLHSVRCVHRFLSDYHCNLKMTTAVVFSVSRPCWQVLGRDISALHFTKGNNTEQGHCTSQKNRLVIVCVGMFLYNHDEEVWLMSYPMFLFLGPQPVICCTPSGPHVGPPRTKPVPSVPNRKRKRSHSSADCREKQTCGKKKYNIEGVVFVWSLRVG